MAPEFVLKPKVAQAVCSSGGCSWKTWEPLCSTGLVPSPPKLHIAIVAVRRLSPGSLAECVELPIAVVGFRIFAALHVTVRAPAQDLKPLFLIPLRSEPGLNNSSSPPGHTLCQTTLMGDGLGLVRLRRAAHPVDVSPQEWKSFCIFWLPDRKKPGEHKSVRAGAVWPEVYRLL